jgi:alpha-1,6-mannosyltransferase
MKVCDVTQAYSPTGGGVRTYLHAKRAGLLARGIEHVLIVPGPVDEVERDGAATTYRVAGAPLPGAPSYRMVFRLDKVLSLLAAERPDVVEVQCPWVMPWTALRHRRRHGGVAVGAYVTDFPTAYLEDPLTRRIGPRSGRWGRRAGELYARTLYSRFDATVAISQVGAARLREMGVERVHCVPLGVDPEWFHPGRRDPAVRAEIGVADDEILVVYAGRLDRERRPDLLLDALELLPPRSRVRLAIAGTGPLRPLLEARARTMERVVLLPFFTDRDELVRLLASADVYASAMPHETFGLAVLEAQACGLPVVGVRSGAMLDRVVAGTGILVRPDSPEAIAEVLESTPLEAWRRMGRNARELVQARYTWDATVDRLLGLYRRLLQEGRGA